MNQSEFEVNTCQQGQARENACERGTVDLILIGWKSGMSFANQSQSVEKQIQSKRKLLSTLN